MKLSKILTSVPGVTLIRDIEIESMGLSSARPGKKLLTFIDTMSYSDKLSPDIAGIITTPQMKDIFPDRYGLLVTEKPRIAYFQIHNFLAQNSLKYQRKIFRTTIGNGCRISKNAAVDKTNVRIGNNVTIEDFVVIRSGSIIGDDAIIRSGSVIGGDGFEYKRDDTILNVIHCGGVIIGDKCRIHHNCSIDRALYPWDDTIIGNDTRIDNGVYMAHGAKVGELCIITGNVVIGGRTVVGNRAKIGFNATLSNGLTIGDDVYIHLGAVVTKNLENGCDVSGNFAIDHDKFIQFMKSIR